MQKQRDVDRIPKELGPAGWKEILNNTPLSTKAQLTTEKPPCSHLQRTEKSDSKCKITELNQDITTDWLIIGAGFAGLSAARRLSQLLPESERIVVVDACEIAEGPAGRNSGFMIDLPHDLNSQTYAGAQDVDLKQIRLNRCAIEFAADMAAQFGMPEQVFQRSGKVTGAASQRGIKHIDSYVRHLDALHEDYQLYDAAQMRHLTGSEYYLKGLFTPGAAVIQPAAFIQQVAHGLSDRVEVYQNTAVTGLQPGQPHRVKTTNHHIKATNIILAVNGHIESFGYLKRHLLHVFTYASMTHALTQAQLDRLGGTDDWGILPADPMGTTVRKVSSYQDSGHRITVRNHFTLNQTLEASPKALQSIVKMHDKSFRARFPMLDDLKMQYRWGGRLCLSLNSVPAFGELEPRIFSAACQNGLGTVKGTLSGMLAAELAVKGQTPMVAEFSHYDKPKKLPIEPFLSLGAKVNLQWKEWLAGKEF